LSQSFDLKLDLNKFAPIEYDKNMATVENICLAWLQIKNEPNEMMENDGKKTLYPPSSFRKIVTTMLKPRWYCHQWITDTKTLNIRCNNQMGKSPSHKNYCKCQNVPLSYKIFDCFHEFELFMENLKKTNICKKLTEKINFKMNKDKVNKLLLTIYCIVHNNILNCHLIILYIF